MDNAERFWAKVNKTDGCWEWTGSLTRGYGMFWLGKMVYSHRLSYVLHHPLTIDLLEHREICVCHRCDNPKCVNPAHLFLGTVVDNMRDRDEKGRGNQAKGEKHGGAILTENDVREIRSRYANGGVLQQQLALEYGVKKGSISNIITRKIWSYITDN